MILRQSTTHPYKSAALSQFEVQVFDNQRLDRTLPSSVVRKLVEQSLEPHIMASTHDYEGRFKDEKSTNNWYSGGKSLFVLNDIGRSAAGIIWFGSKSQDSTTAKTTFAIRMYENYLGQGLAIPFMQTAHYFAEHKLGIGGEGFWLETDQANDVARHIYDKFGYEEIGLTEENRVLMTYHGGEDE